MLTLTGKVSHVFTVPARQNTKTGEEIPASAKVQIMGQVPIQGGQHRLELFDFKTDRATGFQAAMNKTVRVPVQLYNVEGQAGLYMPKGVEIELLNERGEKTGLLDSEGPTPGRKAS